MDNKLKIDVFGDIYKYHVFVREEHTNINTTTTTNPNAVGPSNSVLHISAPASPHHITNQGQLQLTNSAYIDPNMMYYNNGHQPTTSPVLIEDIQRWCSGSFEGRWQLSKHEISMIHSAPVTIESPYKDEPYKAGSFEKNHGLMISFELEGDYTKFLLYWA